MKILKTIIFIFAVSFIMIGCAPKHNLATYEQSEEAKLYMFFYREVEGDKEHKFSTQSEFSNNDLYLKTDKDKLYFIRQYIKFGVFIGGANLEVIDEEEAKKAILDKDMELGLGLVKEKR